MFKKTCMKDRMMKIIVVCLALLITFFPVLNGEEDDGIDKFSQDDIFLNNNYR